MKRRDLRDVCTLYRMEVRGALRDRTIVINSLLIPALLYPLILWLAFLGVSFAVGQAEGLPSRVAVAGWPSGHPDLRREIEGIRRLRLVDVTEGLAADDTVRIAQGELDALVEFLPAAGEAAALRDNFSVRMTFDKSKERSAGARDRFAEALSAYREKWLEREAGLRGIDKGAWQVFGMANRNVASKKQMGAYLLSLLLPIIFAVMVVTGCFYPAIDTTAGERERGTWETLMATPASRGAIVVAKYLSVVTFGFAAGLVNFVSMAVAVKPALAPLMSKAGESLDLTIRATAVPVVVLGALLLAAFAAAGLMLFASFARTFKDGQSLITPFYLIAFLPMLLLQSPGVRLDWRTALVPGANVMLMVRGALTGTLDWAAMGLTVAASVATIGALIAMAAYSLHFEDVAVGSYEGSLAKLIMRRRDRKPAGSRGGDLHD